MLVVKRGEPRQHEEPDVIGAEQAEKRAPRRTLRADLEVARDTANLFPYERLIFRREDRPRNQPEQTQAANDIEEASPAIFRHHQTTQHADRGADFAAGVNQGVREAALVLPEITGKNFRI